MIRTACLSVICLIGSAVAADDPQKSPSKSDEPPAAAQDSTKPDAKPATESKPAPAIGDVDLLKSLEKQLAPPGEAEHPLVKIGSRMRDVQGRLELTDPGDETRGIQKEIVEDIDKLIEQIKKGGACPVCGAMNCTKHGQQNQKRQTSQKQNKPGQPPQQPQKANEPNEGQVTAKPGQPSDQTKEGETRLVRAVWGHLPPKMKEEMEQAFKEGELPKYRVMIERYFRAIAELNESRK